MGTILFSQPALFHLSSLSLLLSHTLKRLDPTWSLQEAPFSLSFGSLFFFGSKWYPTTCCRLPFCVLSGPPPTSPPTPGFTRCAFTWWCRPWWKALVGRRQYWGHWRTPPWWSIQAPAAAAAPAAPESRSPGEARESMPGRADWPLLHSLKSLCWLSQSCFKPHGIWLE